jgi:hypothetical protein
MAASKRGLVDKVKKVVARASTRGAMSLVEGTAAAVRTVDKLQQKLASRRKPEETEAPAEASREQAPAMKAEAPAPKRAATPRTATRAKPAAEEAPAPRTSGRKTMAAEPAAAKRTKAPARKKAPVSTGEFKVKRGQKHLHSGR